MIPSTDKSNAELWLAEKFAEALNRDFGTDYVAEKAAAERDSADAVLVSKSQGCRIGLQLCMATTTERMREEGVQDKLQRRISETLMKQGVSDCIIMVVPRRMPEKADVDAWHDGVVKLVLAHSSNLQSKIELDDCDSPSVFDDLPFSSLTIHKNVLQEKWKGWAIVNFIVVKDVLAVEQTVQEAVDRKIAKSYSDSAELWLLLHPGDGAHTVERIELLATSLRNLDKFAQVWWVYPQRDVGTEIHRFEKKAHTLEKVKAMGGENGQRVHEV